MDKLVRVVVYDNMSDFPDCCGIQVMGDFNSDAIRSTYVEEELTEAGILAGIKSIHSQGLILATTAAYQKLEAAELVKYGFERLSVFRNPNHTINGKMSTVTLWGLKVNQPKGSPKTHLPQAK